jgi:hypothetical protein
VLAWLAEDSLNARQIVTTLAIHCQMAQSAQATKRCGQCKNLKPVTDFCRVNRNRHGLHSLCKDCRAMKRAETRARHPRPKAPDLRQCKRCMEWFSRAETGTLVYCADACFRNRKAVTPVYEQRDAKSSRARAVARADLPGNHLARMQAHPQPQLDTVRAPDMGLLTAEGASDGRVEVVPPCCDLAVGDFEHTHDRHRYLDTVLTA